MILSQYRIFKMIVFLDFRWTYEGLVACWGEYKPVLSYDIC